MAGSESVKMNTDTVRAAGRAIAAHQGEADAVAEELQAVLAELQNNEVAEPGGIAMPIAKPVRDQLQQLLPTVQQQITVIGSNLKTLGESLTRQANSTEDVDQKGASDGGNIQL